MDTNGSLKFRDNEFDGTLQQQESGLDLEGITKTPIRQKYQVIHSMFKD